MPLRLHDVTCPIAWNSLRNKIDEVYHHAPHDHREREGRTAAGRALLKLARIPAFRLFVSVTFGTLLEQAVNRVRGFRTSASTLSGLFAAASDFDDLPAALSDLEPPSGSRTSSWDGSRRSHRAMR